MSLDQLIKKCKLQDRKAQEELYRRYSGKLFLLCLKYSGDPQQAQDTLQDGFLKIFENLNQYSGTGSFEGWMSRIIINTALKKFRDQTVYLSIEEDIIADSEEDFLVDEEQVELSELIRFIQELPERYRHVFNLYVMEGYSHQEISGMLKISPGTSKSNLARARLKLQQSVEAHLQLKAARSL